jgi:predicted enzyme related to lactoylglutathione lyase
VNAQSFPFVRAMPVLDVTDMGRSLAFYRDKLGFSASTWGEPPAFAIVQRGTVSIALALVDTGKAAISRNWAAYVYVADADALYSEFLEHGVAVPHAPETRDYNCRDFSIDDPDGHTIAFGHVLAPDSLGPGLSQRVGRDQPPAPRATAASETGPPWSGGCQCGAVRFRTTVLGRASLCHCRMCQKAFGSIGGLLVTAKDLEWTRGAPSHFQSSDAIRRGFCRDCGTPLTFEWDGGIDIAIASFDRQDGIEPTIQLAAESRMRCFDNLHRLPGPSDVERATKAAYYASVVSRQHPDHDTATWEPKR